MFSNFWVEHQQSLVTFCTALLAIAVSNLVVLRRLRSYRSPAFLPKVSILVPARNEEINITLCLQSLLAQEYPDFEVLVLDDGSADGTAALAAKLVERDPRLRLLTGSPPPDGWLGKHWACHQLAAAATGELLLFTDADTRHHPIALRQAVAALHGEQADLLTVYPHEIVVSWPEKILVPVIVWALFSFLPLVLAHLLPFPSLSATIGQFMLFRRRAYDAIGGYDAIKNNVVDDMELGRRIKRYGFRWRIADGTDLVRCRMYTQAGQVFSGISKSLFGVFEYRVLVFVLIWAWLGVVFLEPSLVLGLAATGLLPGYLAVTPAMQAITLSIALWGLTLWRFRFPLYVALLYPLVIMATIGVALASLVLTIIGRTTWKGRTLIRPGCGGCEDRGQGGDDKIIRHVGQPLMRMAWECIPLRCPNLGCLCHGRGTSGRRVRPRRLEIAAAGTRRGPSPTG